MEYNFLILPKILLMRKLLLFLVSFATQLAMSQVGVGTTNPSSELEISTDNAGIPALELNPQTSPTGTADGQISVIGDKLYMYDATRIKWLSVESSTLQFGRNGNVDNDNLHFGGNMVSGTAGALMPFDGTIVAITSMAASGDDTDVNIRARDVTNTNTIDQTFSLSSLRYINTTTNFNFNAGDYITVRGRDNSTTAVDLTVIIWVKWRVDNP